jgi:hypothetical protein
MTLSDMIISSPLAVAHHEQCEVLTEPGFVSAAVSTRLSRKYPKYLCAANQ